MTRCPGRDQPLGPVDRQAVGRWYVQHAEGVWRFGCSRVGDPRLAEDLTADTFVRALRAVGQTTVAVRDPRAWLVAIAANLVRDHYRSRAHRPPLAAADVGQVAGSPGVV